MSEKSLAVRLRLVDGRQVEVVDAPAGLAALAGLPEGGAMAPVVLLFVRDRAALGRLPGLRARAAAGGIVWIAYSKLTSTLALDLSRDRIREAAAVAGLATVAQIAVDADWSALRVKAQGA